jgi:hypothetical protein
MHSVTAREVDFLIQKSAILERSVRKKHLISSVVGASRVPIFGHYCEIGAPNDAAPIQ